MNEVKKILIAISVLLMLAIVVSGTDVEQNVIYNVYVDNYMGFHRVQAVDNTGVNIPLSSTFDITSFTINPGDTIQWINDANDTSFTIVVKNIGTGMDTNVTISREYPVYSLGFGSYEGTYEVYIKEYPNLKHQTITVVNNVIPTPTPMQTPNMQSIAHKNHVGVGTANLNCDICHGFPPNLYPSEEVCDNCHPDVVPTPVPTVVATPIPTSRIYSYDNIKVNHTIILCNPVSDDEHAITGLTEKNCGNPNLVLNNYPLGVMPSGGESGKISVSEMIMIKVRTDGHISLIPWETQPVEMRWYDANRVNSRLMYSATLQATSFNNEVKSYIGHFSWEINKSGKYFVDVDEGDLGSARVVFNVIDNGRPTVTVTPTVTATVTATVNPIQTATATVTATATPIVTATVTATPIVTYTQTNPPAPEVDNPGPGCWNSYIGFGMCVGDVATKTGVGILLGIGKGIADMFGW